LAISKAEGWSHGETLWVALLAGISHSLSTILIGFTVGFIGVKLYSTYNIIGRFVAPTILFVLGCAYIVIDLKASHYHNDLMKAKTNLQGSKFKVLISLCIIMFLSPCIEIEAYYFIAGKMGWFGIILVSIIYFIITCLGMLLLVNLSYKGMERVRCHYLEYHEKRVTGIVLLILGISELFLPIL